MADTRRFTFEHGIGASGFSRTLAKRVDAYFEERRISKRANAEMVLKTIFGFAAWIATWLWLMKGRLSAGQVVAMYALHGFAQLYMGLNIAHDANHGAYAKSKVANRALGYVFDLVGLSSYVWRLMHNDSHHYYVNIRGADTALVTGGLFRISPHDRRLAHHRFQHLYALFIYCLPTLDWVLAKDYRWLFSDARYGNRHIVRHPTREVIFLFAGKAFYYTYTLVLPLVYLATPWQAVIFGFVLMHVLLGLTLALTFQPNHFTAQSTFPEPDESGRIPNNYIQHIFDNTADYARGNPWASRLTGGLNLHVIHHMFPDICHVHYQGLTPILKSTAEEFGLTYRENKTLSGAFWSHLCWIKRLGKADERVPASGGSS